MPHKSKRKMAKENVKKDLRTLHSSLESHVPIVYAPWSSAIAEAAENICVGFVSPEADFVRHFVEGGKRAKENVKISALSSWEGKVYPLLCIRVPENGTLYDVISTTMFKQFDNVVDPVHDGHMFPDLEKEKKKRNANVKAKVLRLLNPHWNNGFCSAGNSFAFVPITLCKNYPDLKKSLLGAIKKIEYQPPLFPGVAFSTSTMACLEKHEENLFIRAFEMCNEDCMKSNKKSLGEKHFASSIKELLAKQNAVEVASARDKAKKAEEARKESERKVSLLAHSVSSKCKDALLAESKLDVMTQIAKRKAAEAKLAKEKLDKSIAEVQRKKNNSTVEPVPNAVCLTSWKIPNKPAIPVAASFDYKISAHRNYMSILVKAGKEIEKQKKLLQKNWQILQSHYTWHVGEINKLEAEKRKSKRLNELKRKRELLASEYQKKMRMIDDEMQGLA